MSKRSEKIQELRQHILLRLADGQFHSGEVLGAELGVTRAAISQHIKELQHLGLDIFCVTGKGYKLSQPVTLLNAEQILNNAGSAPRLHIFETIDSTNSWLMRALPEGLENGTCCLAEAQTAGRGRRGKNWVSPLASHLYFSTYWQIPGGIPQTMGMSLVVGIAIVRALQDMNILNARLKWPNDIYVNQQKLAGVLVEMEGQTEGPCDLIIGIGINCAMQPEQGKKIDQPWTDLSQLLGEVPDRNVLAGLLIKHLSQLLGQFEEQGFAPFQEVWNRLDVFCDQQVRLISGSTEKTGVCRGVDSNGAIQLAVDGKVTSHFGGELSLRKADG